MPDSILKVSSAGLKRLAGCDEGHFVEILPSALSFRIIASVDVADESEIPTLFNGRVRFVEDDRVVAIGWFTDGLLHDPARKVPAYVRLRSDGQVKQSRRYRRGRLHDPNETEPAVRGFFADGSDRYAEHYQYGRRQDSPSGAPAITKWRQDGTVRSVRRYPAPPTFRSPLRAAADASFGAA